MDKFWTWMVEKKYMEEENEVYFFDLETVKIVHHTLDKEKFQQPMLVGYMLEFIQEKLSQQPQLDDLVGKIPLRDITYEKLTGIIERQMEV